MILLDTHALVCWVSDPGKLSGAARRAVEAASRERAVLASAISLFEIATLVRRRRIDLGVAVEAWLDDVILLPELRIEPVVAEIATLAGSLEDSLPGDPADRIIAATAIFLRTRLVTADTRLRRSPRLQAVW